jgi:protein-S-isoprenylcysteine O-methyltransferase Ste14
LRTGGNIRRLGTLRRRWGEQVAMAKMIAQNLVAFGIFGLLLFVPAGTLAWPQGWALLVIFDACTIVLGMWLRRVDPELVAERMKSPMGRNQKASDRAVMVAIMGAFAGWLVFMALDARRFGWSGTPYWAQALGAVLIVAAFFCWAAVLRANRFAVTTIRLQPERGQQVIRSGPYAIVRHPMYAETLLLFIGAPLLLGSLWGLLGLAIFMPLLALRTLGEEALLMDGLPGYREYAAEVRFRILPGIW